jgi:DNA helicase-2/ATP-dependent DNA helicase PcrA
VLDPAIRLIKHNPNRVSKETRALYGNADPLVQGCFMVWSFANAEEEARAIAESCEQLIAAGLKSREDEIVILVSNRRLQLDMITRELGNRGIPYNVPGGDDIAADAPLRAALSLLRMVQERVDKHDDYVAYRTLFMLHSSVGPTTVKKFAESCINKRVNYRDLFHVDPLPHWITGRSATVVKNIRALVQHLTTWTLDDTLGQRIHDIEAALVDHVFTATEEAQAFQVAWTEFAGQLPEQMTLEDLLMFLRASGDTERDLIMATIRERIGVEFETAAEATPKTDMPKHVRILTMHGAKGLNGKVVFIPSVEQGILPSYRNLQAAGLVIEHRRLFYVSVTRAMAACIISHCALHTGSQAFLLEQKPGVRLARSQFLNEMAVASSNRDHGLTRDGAKAIVRDIDNL